MIEITADPLEALPVKLVGKEYKITPPKSSFAMRIAVQAKQGMKDPSEIMDLLNEWSEKAFGPTQHKAIQKRLEDPKDALDLPHIMQLMEAVIAEQQKKDGAEENPTSS